MALLRPTAVAYLAAYSSAMLTGGQNVTDGPKPEKPADKDLDQALRKIYEQYGPNLSAFFKDVHEQLKREARTDSEIGISLDPRC